MTSGNTVLVHTFACSLIESISCRHACAFRFSVDYLFRPVATTEDENACD